MVQKTPLLLRPYIPWAQHLNKHTIISQVDSNAPEWRQIQSDTVYEEAHISSQKLCKS